MAFTSVSIDYSETCVLTALSYAFMAKAPIALGSTTVVSSRVPSVSSARGLSPQTATAGMPW